MLSDNLLEITIALVYFVGSALYDFWKKKKRADGAESEEGLPPEPYAEPVASPLSPEPEAHSWEMEGLDDPLPTAEHIAGIPAPSAVRATLLLTLSDWERVAASVLSPENVNRVRDVFSEVLSGFSQDSTWSADDDRVGEIYNIALKQLTERVQGASRGLPFLMGRSCAELFTPLLDDLQDDPTTPPWIVLPVGWALEGNATMLAQLCGFVPVLIPEGSRDGLSLFGVLQQNVLELLLSRGEAARELATAAREILGAYLYGKEEVDQDLVLALKRHGGVALVVQGMVAAWVVKGTGPLLDHALDQPYSGARRTISYPLMEGISRLFGRGGAKRVEARETDAISNEAWDEFCVRIAESLDTIRVGHSGRSFGDLALPWGTREDRVCADLLRWSEDPGQTGALRGVVEARVALSAFLMGSGPTPAVPDEIRISRLSSAVELGVTGKSKTAPSSGTAAPASRPEVQGIAGPIDAFLLQVILGPPRALRAMRPRRFRPPHRRVGIRLQI